MATDKILFLGFGLGALSLPTCCVVFSCLVCVSEPAEESDVRTSLSDDAESLDPLDAGSPPLSPLDRLRARVPVEAAGLHLERWRVSGTNISARLLGEDLRAELMLGPEEPITVVSPHRVESIDGYEVTITRRRGSYEFAAWNQDKASAAHQPSAPTPARQTVQGPRQRGRSSMPLGPWYSRQVSISHRGRC